jgi:hypothetical protein
MVGRNELCPCGSGRKYKKCCLAKTEARPMQSPQTENSSAPRMTAEIKILAFPGEAAVLTIVPTFAAGDPRNTNDPKGQPGQYQVTIVLSRPGRFELTERKFNYSDQLTGDSHIAIMRPATLSGPMPGAVGIRVRAKTPVGDFLFDGKPNVQGYLGKLISADFDAQNFDDALKRAYHALAPTLSNWSAHLDVPVYVAQIDATELRTGAASMQVLMPPLEVNLAVDGEPKLESEFLYYAGLYREALNSNSSAYIFL